MAFKKNDAVAVIADWDRKGTVQIRRAIVSAWGKKIIRLRDMGTGEMFKVAIHTGHADRHNFAIVADATEDALTGMALEMGAAIIEHETKRLNHCLTIGQGENYNNAIRANLAELHEPRVHWR